MRRNAVGAAERSHKAMKNEHLTARRAMMGAKQANKEVFIHFNLPTLDQSDIPDWVEEHGEGDMVIADSETCA